MTFSLQRIAQLGFCLIAVSCSKANSEVSHSDSLNFPDSSGSYGADTTAPDTLARIAEAVAVDSAASAAAGDTGKADGLPGEDFGVIRRVPTPDTLRGLYVNRWAAVGRKMWQLIEVARTTEINALVIDVKDDRGFVLYPSGVALASQIGADTNHPMSRRRMRSILDSMAKYDIYPIARIVVAKDPLLAKKRPEWSIKRAADGRPWLDANKVPWLDPHVDEIWDYSVELAREAYELGFAEVQLDYVRFPDDGRLVREAVFPLAQGRVRADVIREQLARTREDLKDTRMPYTIDVFGLTGSAADDMGIGQLWEKFIDQADVVLPMTYPSHYAPGTYGIKSPNANPYQVIDRAIKDMKRRTDSIPGAAKIILWYQDFTLGAPRYGVTEVRAQIKAGYDNGLYSWILWNPRSVYTVEALNRRAVTED